MNPTIFSDGNSPKNPLFSLQPFRLIITFLMNKVSLTNGPKRRSTRGKIKWKLFKSSEGSKFIVSGNEWNQVLSFPFFSAVAESGCGGCAARMCALSWDHQCPLMWNDDGSLCLEGHKNPRLNLSWLVRMTIYGPSPREKKSHSRPAHSLWSLFRPSQHEINGIRLDKFHSLLLPLFSLHISVILRFCTSSPQPAPVTNEWSTKRWKLLTFHDSKRFSPFFHCKHSLFPWSSLESSHPRRLLLQAEKNMSQSQWQNQLQSSHNGRKGEDNDGGLVCALCCFVMSWVMK